MEITKELLLKHSDLTVRELSKVLDIPIHRAYNKVKQFGLFYLFKSKGTAHLPKKVHLIDKKGNVKEYESMYSVATFLGVSKGNITYHLDRGTILKGYSVVTDPEFKIINDKKNKERKISQKIALIRIREKKTNHWNKEIKNIFKELGYFKGENCE